MKSLSTDQFDFLLNQAIHRLEHDGLDRSDIKPPQIDFWLEECEETDTLLIDWDELTYQEQALICYDLRVELHDITVWQTDYSVSDDYPELQYA